MSSKRSPIRSAWRRTPSCLKPSRSGIARLRMVSNGRADLDSIQLPYLEGVCHKRTYCFCHRPATLMSFGEPVTDTCRAVRPVDGIECNGADDPVSLDDRESEAFVFGHLLPRRPDEVEDIVRAAGRFNPRTPACEVGSIVIY